MQTLQQPAKSASTLAHHFKFYDKEDTLSLTRMRRFETKLGERIHVGKRPGKPGKIAAANNRPVRIVWRA